MCGPVWARADAGRGACQAVRVCDLAANIKSRLTPRSVAMEGALISHARGTRKSLGGRLPACSADTFAVIAGLCAEIRDWSSSHGRRS